MSSLSGEELSLSEEVQSNITDVADDSNVANDNNVDDVTNELVESKSGRKIKPSRKIHENYEDRKKSKSKGTKRSKRQSNPALVDLENPVDKTPAVEIPSSTPAVCGYCHKGHQDDPLESGKMFSIAGVTTHYFCMLFTYNSSQLGADSEGLFGFYGDEVKNQIENGKKKCKYCKKRGATARCNKKHCGVYMHFPCGQESGATFQFMGKMHIFCFMHRVKQKVESFPTPPDTDCVICYEKVDQVLEDFKKIRAPCCGRHFHRDCVQRFAMTSGTQHFKCPNCNNHDEITKEFKKNGVYIPYKDAEWELPGQQDFYNWNDHYVQTKRCSAKECVCKEKEGRSFNEFENEIILCDLCGTNGVHMKCGNINEDTLDYACVDCGGDVALEERTFESRNSSLASSSFNLSLASTVNDSLADTSTSTVDDSFNSDKDISISSMPNIRDFIKQFEITPSVSPQDSLLKNSESDLSVASHQEQSRNELSEEVLSKRPHKKRGPKSKTQPQISTPVSEAPIVEEANSKHNFFKHTEEVTKMLEDLKRKEQENKSKDAFFKSLTAAQSSEKKESVPDSSEASLDFKNYLAKSLGKEVPVAPLDPTTQEFDDLQSKIDDLTRSIGLPSLDAFTFETPAEPLLPQPAMSRTIKVRTDLLAVTEMFESNNIMETDVTLSEEAALESMDDDETSSEGIEISEKKRAFGAFLFSKQKSKTSSKKESSYIEFFYQHMDKSEAAVKNVQMEESVSVSTEPTATNVLEDSIDDANEMNEITLNEMIDDDIPEEAVADTSLGLEIVDTFTCSDSFIDELLNSPVKSPDKKAAEGPKEATAHEDEEISDNNDAPGTNLIDTAAVPTQASHATQNVEEAPKEAATEPVKAVVTKPRAGPRSRTKPSEPPVKRTSPSKIKESIVENIKIFEEEAKALKSKPLEAKTNPIDNGDVEEVHKNSEESATPDEEKSNDTEPETIIKYRPGPKSRKKYLVVKEAEPKEMTKVIDSSPKRSLESSNDPVFKKQKTQDVVSEGSTTVVNLDSTISSDGSNLEIIDLDESTDAPPVMNATSDLTKLDTSTKDVIKEVTNLLGPSKENKKVDETTANVEKESAPTDEAIVEISPPPVAVSSAPAAAGSKRASKRPFQCPVCQGFFRSEMVLQQHLAKIHFWNRLLALPKEASTGSGPVFQCSEFPCRYIHKSQTIVAGHLATEHKVVFKIALNIFPDFKLPILPLPPSSDPSITILASVPGRLPPVSEYPGKRSLSLSRPEEDQNKKPKQLPSQAVRPVILPSQPHKAVARVKPRTAPVQPTVQQRPQIVEAPLKPVYSPFPAQPLPGQQNFLQKSLDASNC